MHHPIADQVPPYEPGAVPPDPPEHRDPDRQPLPDRGLQVLAQSTQLTARQSAAPEIDPRVFGTPRSPSARTRRAIEAGLRRLARCAATTAGTTPLNHL